MFCSVVVITTQFTVFEPSVSLISCIVLPSVMHDCIHSGSWRSLTVVMDLAISPQPFSLALWISGLPGGSWP